jgi:peroxiredoxin
MANLQKKSRRVSPLPLILTGSGLIVLAFALAFVLSPAQGEPEADDVQTEGVNYPAPSLTLTDINGKTVSLADYRGQWVLVNHWAIWCPPCKAEMPELNAYYQAHKDEDFVLIGISAGDAKADVVEFTSSSAIQFPMWLDPKQTALSAFRTDYLPSSFVIDPEGMVRLFWTGAVTLDVLEARVTPLLEN